MRAINIFFYTYLGGPGSCAYGSAVQGGTATCYKIMQILTTWPQAYDFCNKSSQEEFGVAMGYGRLAAFPNTTIYNQVLNQLNAGGGGPAIVWVGGHSQLSSTVLDTYCWMASATSQGAQITRTKQPLPYTNTGSGSPQWLFIDTAEPYNFHSDDQNSNHFALCEIGNSLIP